MFVASILSAFAPLALLACPVGMGMMMRGGKTQTVSVKSADRPASIEVLREEQRRLDEQINHLERGTGTAAGIEGKR